MNIFYKLLIMFCLLFSEISIGSTEIPVDLSELKCMTDNIYFEARSEPIIGQVLVGKTVINRLQDSKWPNTICKVVYQKSQYSWTASPLNEIDDYKSYALAQSIAFLLLRHKDNEDPYLGDHYLRCDYRDKVSWWKSMRFLGQVGKHCFYTTHL